MSADSMISVCFITVGRKDPMVVSPRVAAPLPSGTERVECGSIVRDVLTTWTTRLTPF